MTAGTHKPGTDSGRRRLLQGLGGLALTVTAGPLAPAMAAEGPHRRRIPRGGETIPAIGLGSWLTFNTLPFTAARAGCVEVLRAFVSLGGTLVDSSPMYGMSEATIGDALAKTGGLTKLFSATKVWIHGRLAGITQMKASAALWGVERFDLMQVHNLVDWETHLKTLIEWKTEKRIRYIGVTTSHGRRHEAMEQIIAEQPAVDFVQFSYNIADREAERRLLPAAAEQGKAVIINRPFRTGGLFELVRGKPLPAWAAEIGCSSWAPYLLKFVISHPAVTCVIPATSRAEHLRENMQALHGPLPDAVLRRRMAEHFRGL
jgi:diketogulonate reductase-like aldo/keto reductase